MTRDSASPDLVHLADESATAGLAQRLAPELARGDLVLLVGDLGAGKTAFVRHLAAALGLAPGERVSSPSYALVNEYLLAAPHGAADTLAHLDLYRIADDDELAGLGFDELVASAITVVEWPERAPSLWPRATLVLRIEILGDTSRQVTIERRRAS